MTGQPIDLQKTVARHEAELIALRHWLKRLFVMVSAKDPDAYVALVREMIKDAKNAIPPDDLESTPANGERILGYLQPFVIQLGEDIVEVIEMQAGQDLDG